MKVKDLLEEYNIESWREYRPSFTQYAKFSPHEVLAALKIEDVYQQVSNARASLLYMEVEDYGKLISKNDDLHLTYIRAKFLFDALANYNYSIDLSWQFLYLYYGDDDYGMIEDKKRYMEAMKECNKKSLKHRLVSHRGEKNKYDFLMNFFERPLTEEIRDAYNYIKHRGTFHIEGLGVNENSLPFTIKGTALKKVNRETINLEEWKEKLISFDISFYKYFNELINVMPDNFKDGIAHYNDIVNFKSKVEKWYEEKIQACDKDMGYNKER